jgi:hypothetical protein
MSILLDYAVGVPHISGVSKHTCGKIRYKFSGSRAEFPATYRIAGAVPLPHSWCGTPPKQLIENKRHLFSPFYDLYWRDLSTPAPGGKAGGGG